MLSIKMLRVQQIIAEEISSLIVMGGIKDPRVSNRAMVLSVKVSGDTTSATVFISGYIEDHLLQKTVDALNHARGFIQRQIAKKYVLRNTPKLRFKKTEAVVQAEKVLQTIKNLSPHEVDENTGATDTADTQ